MKNSPGLVHAKSRSRVSDRCVAPGRQRQYMIRGWGCGWGCGDVMVSVLLCPWKFHCFFPSRVCIYVIYSRKNCSPVHRLFVSCWFSLLPIVKGWGFQAFTLPSKPSHPPSRYAMSGEACEGLKVKTFTPFPDENHSKTDFLWTCECFFGNNLRI